MIINFAVLEAAGFDVQLDTKRGTLEINGREPVDFDDVDAVVRLMRETLNIPRDLALKVVDEAIAEAVWYHVRDVMKEN